MNKKKIIFYACILLGLTLINQMFSSYNYSYYVDEAALITLQQASLAKVIFLCFDGLNDLFFGYLSDKFAFKTGKRKTWLVFGLPLFCVSFLLTFAVDSEMNLSSTQFFLYYIFITTMFDNFSSLMYVNYNALYPAIFLSEEERTSASSYKHIFEILGTGIVFLSAPILKEKLGYLTTCAIFSAISILIIMVSLMNVSEPTNRDIGTKQKFSFASTWKAAFKNKGFIWYLLSNASFLIILGTLVTILPFLMKYTLKINGIQQSIVTGVAFVLLFFSLKGWTRVIKKKGHRYAYLWSFRLLPLVIFVLASAFNFWTTLIAVLLAAPCLGGILITPDLMMAEIIDRDYQKYHVRREAVLMSISSFARRLSLIIAALLLMLISSFSGYQDGANPGNHPELTFRLITMVFLPIIGLIGTISAQIYLKVTAEEN